MNVKNLISKALTAVLTVNMLFAPVPAVHAEITVGTEVNSCPKETIVDSGTGRTYYYMNIDGKTTVKPYVTMQNWNSDGTKFLVMTPDDNKMYEYDTVNETLRFLDYGAGSTSLNAVVTPDNQIYYTNNRSICKIDWNTYTKTVVCPYPYGCNSLGNIQVTNDGKYLNGYFGGFSGGNSIVRIDLENGVVDTLLKKDFSYNQNTQGVGHPIINPEYPELLFFCHEGTTTLIPDRLWLANADTGEMFNLFVQSERDDGLTGECSGHEVWGMDGEYLYFVKYAQSQNMGQNGLMRVTKDGSEREYINGDFAYWHCYPSSDNNWVVGDTNTGQIAIANTKTHESRLLVKFRMYSWQHPYQPHPVISYSNNTVNWQMANSANVCGLGWTHITDLTGSTDIGGRTEFNSRTDIISYENTVSTASRTVKNGISCISAAGGKALFADIKDHYIKNTNQRLTLTLSYIDEGTEPLSIIYSSGVNSNRDLHKFEDNEILIEKTDSGEEKTVEIDLGYVNVNNIGNFRSDLRISSRSEAVYVTDIKPKIASDALTEVHKRGSFVISGMEGDITKGIYALSQNLVSSYRNHMLSVDDTAGCTAAGISDEAVTSARSKGIKYITPASDGGWMYRTATAADGITKQTWFTSKNYRTDTGASAIGTVYYRISDDYVTSEDSSLKFFIEYLDKGTANLSFKYYSTSGIKNVNIARTDTNQWKTAELDVSDAMISANNSGTALATGQEDFIIAGNGTDTYISKVSVIKQKDYEYIDTADYIPPANTGDKPTVYIVSDAFGEDVPCSQFPRAGWGMEIDRYFSSDVSFVNMSARGMSTQSFLDGAYRDNISKEAKQGDYLFLQLGSDEESTAVYANNLKAVADYAGEQGLNLVFLTPAHERVFSPDGTVADDGGDAYRSAMISAAAAIGVPVLDVGRAHGELIEKLGTEGSKQIFMYTDSASYPDCTYENTVDDTVINQQGAIELSKLIAGMIKEYSDSGLKSLAVLSEYVCGDTSLMEAPVYQPVSAKTDITDVMYKIDGSPSSYIRPGRVGVKLKATNRESESTDAVLYTVVYNANGSVTDIAQSPRVSIEPGQSVSLETDGVTLPDGDEYKLKKFVWTSSLRPYSQRDTDLLGLVAHGYNGRAVITWQKFSGFPAGTTYQIYRDGVLVGETDSNSFIDENVPRGEHSWQVNAVNSIGIFLYQSNFAVDFVSGMEDVPEDVFYTKAFINSQGKPEELNKNMELYWSNTYYPIPEARKHYPHVTVTNLFEAYSYDNISYITDGSDGSVRMAKVTDSYGVTKDAWQTARVYRVTGDGKTAVRNCFMYFSFEDGTITPEDHDVTVYVEYLADRDSLQMQYANCIIDGENVTAFNESGTRLTNSVRYGDGATGSWRVARFELDDAYFNEEGTTFVTKKCDLRLACEGKELSVSSITVVKGNASVANEHISKLGSMEFYDGYIHSASSIYPDGVYIDVSGGEEISSGIRSFLMTGGDTDAIGIAEADIDGKYYLAPGNDTGGQNLLYFDVDDRYMFGAAESSFEIELTYKADFDGELIMKAHSYDIATGRLGDAEDFVLTSVSNDGLWKTETFAIDGAAFIDSMTGSCDFGLYTPMGDTGNQLKVRRLSLSNQH